MIVGLTAIAFGLFVSPESFVRFATLLSPDKQLQRQTIEAVQGTRIILVVLGTILIFIAIVWRKNYRAIKALFHGMINCSPRSFMLVIMSLALLLRLAFALSFEYIPIADYGHYHQHAVDLAEGRGYINFDLPCCKDGEPATTYPFGWPFFLSLLYRIFGPSYTAPKVANSIIGGLTCILIFKLGKRYYTEKVARSAALLLAFFPTHVCYAAQIGTETLFTLLFLGSLLLIERAYRFKLELSHVALAGFGLGLACYVRAVPIALPAFLVPAWWLTMRKFWRPLLAGIVLMGVMLAVLFPWSFRNYVRTGHFIFGSSDGATSFYLGNIEKLNDGTPKYKGYSEVLKEYGGNPNAGYYAGLKYIAEQPLSFFGRGFIKVLHLYKSDNTYFIWLNEIHGSPITVSATAKQLIFLITGLFYYPTLILACFYIILRITRRLQIDDWLLLLIVGYWTLLHFCISATPRFLFPLVPILILFACECFFRIVYSWQAKEI